MKILLVQTAFLGDVALSTPLFRAIHQLFPGCELSVMTTVAGASLIERDPLIKQVIPFDKRGKYRGLKGFLKFAELLKSYKFDRVYSLHRSIRTSLLLKFSEIPCRVGFRDAWFSFCYHKRKTKPKGVHAVMRALSILEGEGEFNREDNSLKLYAPERSQVREEIQSLADDQRRRILIFPGSEWETKRWHWKEYQRLAVHYASQEEQVVLIGSKDQQGLSSLIASADSRIINLTGQTSLSEVLFLVKNASVIICNDSMALHLAAGFQKPVVAIFCATSPQFGFGPWKTPSLVVQNDDLSCKPCRRHGGRVCPLGTESCMRGVSAERVIQNVERLLSVG